MEIKQRHASTKEQRVQELISNKTKNFKSTSMLQRGISVFGFLFLILLCLCLYTDLLPKGQHYHAVTFIDRMSLAVGLQKKVYAVMFDAGSTGSRIFVFTFHRDVSDGSLKLLSEFYKEVKPGLSYYSSNPVQAADSLQPLLNHAKNEIPEAEWSHTPLLLKATAGLRLLPGDQAQAILNEVEKIFRKSPFHVGKNSVSIMEGSDEGLFSWFTINFLLDKLSEIETTVASFDLGGGSTQITFSPIKETTIKSGPEGHIQDVTLLGSSIKLYVHSYLGLGLMAARLDILKLGNKIHNSKPEEFYTPCLYPSSEKKWEYSGSTYTIRGTEKDPEDSQGLSRFDQCYKIAQSVVNNKVYRLPELQERTIYAISYYYDRAAENGLIDFNEGGQITVGDYFTVGKKVCEEGNSEHAFACLDLAYISALLSDGIGLSHSKEIMLKKKLQGYETSWALGAAFSVIAD